MTSDPDDAAIVRSIVDLAHSLGLRVVAEGVETIESWRALEVLGCDLAQGYLISRPVPGDEVVRWLAAHAAVGDATESAGGAMQPMQPVPEALVVRP